MIRIVLADDHKMFREALHIPLGMEPDMSVVAEAGSGAELLALLEKTSADILVLDIGLPDINGIGIAQRVGRLYPALQVVVLSGYTDKIFVEEVMKAGARAFVAKSAGSDELVFAIRAVTSGKIYLSPDVTVGMIRHMTATEPNDAPPVSVLGKREKDVLRLLADGKTSLEIGGLLGISGATVDVHRRNIRQKLGLNSIAELTRYAIREGLASVK